MHVIDTVELKKLTTVPLVMARTNTVLKIAQYFCDTNDSSYFVFHILISHGLR